MVDLEQTTIAEQLKRIAGYRGYNMKNLCEEYNKKFGTNYIQQSFSRKIGNGAFRFDELQQLGEILGFKVKFELVDKREEG